MRRHASETGAALLTVLLLVAVISALAVLALDRLKLATALAANGAAAEQARAYALGGEALARARVAEVVERIGALSQVPGGWQGRPLPIPVAGGQAVARLFDGGNCFNLNGLAEGSAATGLTARPAAVAQFGWLMRLLGVPETQARGIAAAAADWIDSDRVPQPGGAEDEAYARAETPYAAGNTLMADVSELRTVAGVTPDIYRRLRPYLCALPVAEAAPINPNTLVVAQAPLVAMLFGGRLSAEEAARLIAARPAAGFDTPQAMLAPAALQGIVPDEGAASLDLKPRWFALRLDVGVGGQQVRETALIDAGQRPARVVQRRWGEDE